MIWLVERRDPRVRSLKRLEFLRWLVKTEISVPALKPERSNGSPTATKRPDDTRTITVFEVIISHLLGLVDVDGEPLASSLTDVVIDICAPDSGIEPGEGLFKCRIGSSTVDPNFAFCFYEKVRNELHNC